MAYTSNSELDSLADELYEASGDDDFRLAELLRQLPKETAIRLCTSDLTNALQTYIYAFQEEPDIEIYELLLLQPSSMISRGIRIGNVELADIVFGFDKKSNLFFIAVWNGEKFIKAFSGPGAYREAVRCAKEQCA